VIVECFAKNLSLNKKSRLIYQVMIIFIKLTAIRVAFAFNTSSSIIRLKPSKIQKTVVYTYFFIFYGSVYYNLLTPNNFDSTFLHSKK